MEILLVAVSIGLAVALAWVYLRGRQNEEQAKATQETAKRVLEEARKEA